MPLSLRYAKGYGTTSYFPLSAITDRLNARNQLLERMVIFGGKERMAQEFATLLRSAGLPLAQVTPVNGSFFSVVEATPA
jgi:hypothetical protein